MAEDYIQVPPDSTGKKIRNEKVTVGPNDVYQQVVTLAFADGTLLDSGGGVLPVSGPGGLPVNTEDVNIPNMMSPAGTPVLQLLSVQGSATGTPIRTSITDGTNGPATVKAASTAVVAADKALVITVSPNTPFVQSVGTDALQAITVQGAADTVPITVQGAVTVTASVDLPVNIINLNGSPAVGSRVSANSFPVVIASDQLVPVSDGGFSLTVDGSITANAGTNLNTSLLALESTQTNRTAKTQITDGTRDGTIKAASTLPLLTDTAIVTTQRDPLPAGTSLLGKVGIDQTTPGTTNKVAADVTQVGGAALSEGQKTMAASVPVVLASDQTAVPVSGPLTDTQLRATPVPVSTGDLTDTQLRATAVPVSGPLTDTQLRATPVPVSGNVSLVTGTNLIGKVGIDQTTPGTTNKVDAELRSTAIPDLQQQQLDELRAIRIGIQMLVDWLNPNASTVLAQPPPGAVAKITQPIGMVEENELIEIARDMRQDDDL